MSRITVTGRRRRRPLRRGASCAGDVDESATRSGLALGPASLGESAGVIAQTAFGHRARTHRRGLAILGLGRRCRGIRLRSPCCAPTARPRSRAATVAMRLACFSQAVRGESCCVAAGASRPPCASPRAGPGFPTALARRRCAPQPTGPARPIGAAARGVELSRPTVPPAWAPLWRDAGFVERPRAATRRRVRFSTDATVRRRSPGARLATVPKVVASRSCSRRPAKPPRDPPPPPGCVESTALAGACASTPDHAGSTPVRGALTICRWTRAKKGRLWSPRKKPPGPGGWSGAAENNLHGSTP